MINKQFLNRHAELRRELQDELRRYELMHGCSYYGKSPSDITGMPLASSGEEGGAYSQVERTLDSESYIKHLQGIILQEENLIEDLLQKLPKANQKTVIRIKYFQLYDWDDVALFMFGDVKDYARNEEKYKSKAQKIHGTALANIINLQKEN